MRPRFPWLAQFDQLTWSCDLGVVKPDPAIYLHTVKKLAVSPGQALFIDNLEKNITGAEAVGLHAALFENLEQPQNDLVRRGFRTLLPRGAGWRIALYAVFRKENRTRDPLQRSQGGSKGQGWEINPEDDPSAGGAALNAYESCARLGMERSPPWASNDWNMRPIRFSRPGGPVDPTARRDRRDGKGEGGASIRIRY
jgi:hypothetical protein